MDNFSTIFFGSRIMHNLFLPPLQPKKELQWFTTFLPPSNPTSTSAVTVVMVSISFPSSAKARVSVRFPASAVGDGAQSRNCWGVGTTSRPAAEVGISQGDKQLRWKHP